MCLVEVSSTRAAVPDGSTERVRLLGIDTPELAHDGDAAQCGGEEARYGRLLRYVETDDGDAGATLISEGYAYAWTPDSAPDPATPGAPAGSPLPGATRRRRKLGLSFPDRSCPTV